MKTTEDDIQIARLEFYTLDSQFNNLTAKELFHVVISHVERLFPNARQLQE